MRLTTSLLAATALTFGLASASYAADLIIEEPEAPIGIVDVGDWNGAYIGASVGGAWGTQDGEYDDFWDYFDESYDLSGWLGGVQAGANFQMDSFVLGIEGDISWADISGDSSDISDDWVYTDVDWVGTLRARAGLAFDSILLYATAGVAFASVSQWVDDDWSGDTDTVTDTRFGWVAGVGAEALVTDNVSLKGEVLFHDLAATDTDFDNGVTYYDNSVSFTTFKVGVNFHF
ncbi:outer membrane protein [Devosia sp. CN2-171]|jgi:outer membrane immunogenic protein|uniref:outer membrane protein n=1 Tax=Devosia sp. CN2-171 TaxID=3400909 RepID=UPI003BF88CB5